MSQTARRKITITFQGDVNGENEYDAADNDASPACITVSKFTAAQNTTVVPPTFGNADFTPTCVTIEKPADYTGEIRLKGISALSVVDTTGVLLHPTDPDCISLGDAENSTLVINCSVACTLRFIWS